MSDDGGNLILKLLLEVLWRGDLTRNSFVSGSMFKLMLFMMNTAENPN